MRTLRLVLVMALALTLAVPAMAQKTSNGTPGFAPPGPPPEGTSRVTFYGYVFASTLISPMPANTQYPWGVADWGAGTVDTPINCGLPSQESCDTYAINKLALFTTAGPVQVKNTAAFAYDKLHNENGGTQDVLFDQTQSVTATLHLSTAAHAWPHNENETACIADPPQNIPCVQTYWRWHSGASPNLFVRAWLYAMVLGEHGADANRAPPIQDQIVQEKGTLLAVGESAPTNVISLDGASGNERVWRFDIDLGTPLLDRVPKEANLVLVYSVANKAPDGSEVGIGQTLRWNSGEFFPTYFTIPVKNAFTMELVAPRVLHDKLVTVAVMNTPWGSYDLDPTSLALEMRDASGTKVDMPDLKLYGDYSVAHGGHYKPMNVTFVWDHKAAKLPPGAYTITVSAANYQRSASDSLTAKIEVDAAGRLVSVEPGRKEASLTADQVAEFSGEAAPAEPESADGNALALPAPLAPAPTFPVPVPALGAATALGLALALRRRSP